VSDAYTRELDEVMAAVREEGFGMLGPVDPRLGGPGVVACVPFGSPRLRPLAERFKLTPSGRKHTIIEFRGVT
jgi:hypothetical protein